MTERVNSKRHKKDGHIHFKRDSNFVRRANHGVLRKEEIIVESETEQEMIEDRIENGSPNLPR